MFHRVKKSSDDKSYMLSNLISHVVEQFSYDLEKWFP